METLLTEIWGMRMGVRADWSQAADTIYTLDGEGEWVPTKWQVADACHWPGKALEFVLEDLAITCGDNPSENQDVAEAIADAIRNAAWKR